VITQIPEQKSPGDAPVCGAVCFTQYLACSSEFQGKFLGNSSCPEETGRDCKTAVGNGLEAACLEAD